MIATTALLAMLVQAEEAAPRVATNTSWVLKVSDRAQTADTLIAAAEGLGGYFTQRSDDQVVLKVPVAEAKAMLQKAEPLGVVVERKFEALDIGARLDEQRTLLKSREEVLARYFKVLDEADTNTVVQVESEMTRLIEQIESLKGSIRLMEHQLRYATVTIGFQFRERRPPTRDGTSSFAWLNTVNLADLLGEFGHEE